MNTTTEKLTKKFMNSLQSILDQIDLESIDSILDSRDNSNQWTKAWNDIGSKKIKIDKEREDVFKLILSKTESDDLAAYVTEYFELITNYIELPENNWVTTLCQYYFNGKIPDGEIESSKKTLIELIKE